MFASRHPDAFVTSIIRVFCPSLHGLRLQLLQCRLLVGSTRSHAVFTGIFRCLSKSTWLLVNHRHPPWSNGSGNYGGRCHCAHQLLPAPLAQCRNCYAHLLCCLVKGGVAVGYLLHLSRYLPSQLSQVSSRGETISWHAGNARTNRTPDSGFRTLIQNSETGQGKARSDWRGISRHFILYQRVTFKIRPGMRNGTHRASDQCY
jgi:hypothetical protein